MMSYKDLGKTRYFVEGVTTIGGQAADLPPPDWPRVHAIEPELRPFDESDGIDLSALSGGSPLARFRGSLWERVYLELCAMKAVRWLANQPDGFFANHYPDGWHVASVYVGPMPRQLSLDHALFAAVEAVMRSRAAPPPPTAPAG